MMIVAEPGSLVAEQQASRVKLSCFTSGQGHSRI